MTEMSLEFDRSLALVTDLVGSARAGNQAAASSLAIRETLQGIGYLDSPLIDKWSQKVSPDFLLKPVVYCPPIVWANASIPEKISALQDYQSIFQGPIVGNMARKEIIRVIGQSERTVRHEWDRGKFGQPVKPAHLYELYFQAKRQLPKTSKRVLMEQLIEENTSRLIDSMERAIADGFDFNFARTHPLQTETN